MSKHWKYLNYVIRHKWYVFLECRKLGITFLGIIHDWSKFRLSEWLPYAQFFYGKDNEKIKIRDETGYYKPHDTGSESFDFAWFLHQKRNKHHWQYWLLPTDEEGEKILPMPNRYRKEMIADWIGASRAQGSHNINDVHAWYRKHRSDIRLHTETRQWIEYESGLFG